MCSVPIVFYSVLIVLNVENHNQTIGNYSVSIVLFLGRSEGKFVPELRAFSRVVVMRSANVRQR